ncbi:PREDICTED: pathogenesis-related protein PR-1-like [Camelina sativa]|uniref:Pathogenesis-related protein PR-1-like n=1 Tax=Camelina sativa TaxID=90675 RepID=A0ABM1QI52_CAMSA|nr:PREDICTED: pathogenesis-related protein PR-1-like [Camelina sativa]
MNSSCLRVILLLGAINAVVSLTITRSSTITKSSSITKFSSLGHVFQICKGLCPGCDHDSLQFLFRHNLVRAARFEPPLMWDSRLQNYAQGWANQRRGDCALRHSFSNGQFNLGENIYWGFGANWSPADAVVAWASEKRFYHYGSNTCDPGQMCGHYTQIVWKNTRRGAHVWYATMVESS